MFREGVVLERALPDLSVHPRVVVEQPEHPDPIVDVLQAALLFEAWKQVVEALQPVFQGLVQFSPSITYSSRCE